MNSCGYSCFPATKPEKGEPYDCAHNEDQHYDIDGEAVGCYACEDRERTWAAQKAKEAAQ